MQHHTTALELKSLDEQGRFAGYASLFGNIDNQKDIVERGAFAATLRQPLTKIKLLWQHQMGEPIGQITRLFEDNKGLYVEGQLLLSVQRAREAYELIKSGAMDGLSIGYRPHDYRIDAQTGIRQINQLDLFEISLVTFPANQQAGVMVVKSNDSLPPSQLVALNDALNNALHTLTN